MQVCLFVGMSFAGQWFLLRGLARRRGEGLARASAHPLATPTRVARVVALLEVVNAGVTALWYVLFLNVIVGVIVEFVIIFAAPFFVVYLQYYRKGVFDEARVALVYGAGFLVPLLVSAAGASAILTLAGIPNWFVFLLA